MRKRIPYLISILILAFYACSEPFVPDTNIEQPIVVEGYIEAGEGSNITYVILTKALPFISEINADQISDLFVNDAIVKVNDGNQDVELTELCLNDLPFEIQVLVAENLGLSSIDPDVNICAYVDIADQLIREEGRAYDLEIKAENQLISATTTIPAYVPLYDFRFDDPPGEPSEVFARLFCTIDDPAGVKNYYRYKTAVNNRPLISPFASVINDVFYDGQTFEFPLSKAEDITEEVSFEEFGLFTRGDSITLKWMTIDEAHYDFWNTRDFSANSQGPFSGYTRIASNVNGALGIWGGYAVANYRLYVNY